MHSLVRLILCPPTELLYLPLTAVGTKKFEKIKRSADRRGQGIVSCIDTYNTLVRRLEALERPSWIDTAAVPALIKKTAVFTSDIDSDLWSEVTMGSAWSQLWQNDPTRPTAPPWVQNPDVRLGIKHKLLVDRIAEEEIRLDIEAVNMAEWLKTAVLSACRVYRAALCSDDGIPLPQCLPRACSLLLLISALGNALSHRLREYLIYLLDKRSAFLRTPPNEILWVFSTSRLLGVIDQGRDSLLGQSPSEFIHTQTTLPMPSAIGRTEGAALTAVREGTPPNMTIFGHCTDCNLALHRGRRRPCNRR